MGKVLGLALRDQQPLGVAAGVFSNLQNWCPGPGDVFFLLFKKPPHFWRGHVTSENPVGWMIFFVEDVELLKRALFYYNQLLQNGIPAEPWGF